MLHGKSVLVTGGTGSFGKMFTNYVLKNYKVKKLIIFSRDELKQFEMQQMFPMDRYANLRFFIGDIRDRSRLERAFHKVDIVVHAAALKQVPACEYNPFEAIQTNVIGAKNIIDAAIDTGVKKVIALSTDKAVNPANLYGATKLCAEKLFLHGSAYVGRGGTQISCVRYGNVIGSRGSVIPLFVKQRKIGKVTITDSRMTRFWITLEHGVKLVLHAMRNMKGGEIYVPKIPSMLITDLVKAIAPDCKIETTGIRPGEKLHEILISREEGRHTYEKNGVFTIMPTFLAPHHSKGPGTRVSEDYCFASDTNTDWLTVQELKKMAAPFLDAN